MKKDIVKEFMAVCIGLIILNAGGVRISHQANASGMYTGQEESCPTEEIRNNDIAGEAMTTEENQSEEESQTREESRGEEEKQTGVQGGNEEEKQTGEENRSEEEKQTKEESRSEEEKVQTALENGLKKKNGSLYYYRDGKPVKKSLVHCAKGVYYFDKKGQAVRKKWKTIEGKKYYFRKNGKAAVGRCRIQKKYYFFKDDGSLYASSGLKVVKMGKARYCIGKNGQAAPGWHYIGEKVYYAEKTGACAAGKKVDYIAFTSKGYAKNTDQALAKILAREFIDAHCDPSMSDAQKFKACFHYIIAYTNFVGSWRPERFEEKGWQYRAAVSMFQTDLVGSCYGVGSAIAAVAKELGYQPYVITVTAGHCFVMIDGRYYDNMYGAVFGAASHPAYKVKEKMKF